MVDIEALERLIQYQEQLEARIKNLEIAKIRLESQLDIFLDARIALAEEINLERAKLQSQLDNLESRIKSAEEANLERAKLQSQLDNLETRIALAEEANLEKAQCESQLDVVRTRTALEVEAKKAEEIDKSKNFRESFCSQLNNMPQAILELVDTGGDVILLATPFLVNVPPIIAAMIVIKITKVGIYLYCKDS